MIVLGYRFEPKLWAITVTIACVIIFVELGKWQLSRANEKETQYEQLERYSKEPPLALPDSVIRLKDFQYREVEVEGEYISEHTIYLDNKVHKGRAVYHIITPLRIEGSQLNGVINRGWTAVGEDRTLLPEVIEYKGNVKITGVVVSPELRALNLANKLSSEGKVWANFDLLQYQQNTGLMMQPIMILQRNQVEDSLIRDWDKPESGSSKNLGYAFQWFSLAVTAIIIFLILNVKRKNSKNK